MKNKKYLIVSIVIICLASVCIYFLNTKKGFEKSNNPEINKKYEECEKKNKELEPCYTGPLGDMCYHRRTDRDDCLFMLAMETKNNYYCTIINNLAEDFPIIDSASCSAELALITGNKKICIYLEERYSKIMKKFGKESESYKIANSYIEDCYNNISTYKKN